MAKPSRQHRVRLRRLGVLGGLALAAIGALLAPAHAAAEPLWDVHTRWGDTNLKPGGAGQFFIQVKNYGDSASSGTVTVTNPLPSGVERVEPAPFDSFVGRGESRDNKWSCSGTTTVSCTRTGPIEPRDSTVEGDGVPGAGYAERIIITVNVAASAPEGTYTNTTTVSGGGGISGSDVDSIAVSSTSAGYGVTPGSFLADAFDAEYPAGDVVRQAGAHPFEMRVNFDLNQQVKVDPEIDPRPADFPGMVSAATWTDSYGHIKTGDTVLPRGMIGNPEATPKCDALDFATPGPEQYTTTGCPPETQVGTIAVEIADGPEYGGFGAFGAGAFARVAVYNLEPPKGVPADFGFLVGFVRGHVYPELDATNGYAIRAKVPLISNFLHVRQAEFSLWGVPGDPAHDHLRSTGVYEDEHPFGASSSAPIKPLLTMPMDCDAKDLRLTGRFDFWQDPGNFGEPLQSDAMEMEGCDDLRFRFKPQVSLRPTSLAASGPTGLEVNLEVPQRRDIVSNASELYEENGEMEAIPTPPMKKVEVTFPEGMTISTSAAQGMSSCSLEQIKLGTNEPISCPDSSQYGTLTVETPILPPGEPMRGQIYIAEQDRNPFDDFLALYLVVQEPERGILVKIPGHVKLDERTGQIKTTFDNLPPFPVSNMQMALKGGVRAALVNPSTCGTKQITATFTPWHRKSETLTRTSSYDITHKGDGSPCVGNLAQRPFAPQISAGTVSNSAGAFSPFVFRLTRTDDDQEIASLATKLPKGLLAKVAGITQCSEAAIAASGHKTGNAELESPSCPVSSYLGTADVGSGVGQILTFVQGKAYLAGPYKGAPLSMVVVTPVVAGPYDLGTIAVRTALDVDRTTAQVEVATDPFPQVFKGIPVRIRDIRIAVDRPQGTLNPTSCDPMAIEGRIGGVGGDLFSAADDISVGLFHPFQAASCAALGFKPTISLELKGGTKRGQFPALTARLKARPGDANIRKARVTLPRTAFLEQGHIRTICTRVQFAAKACPPGSVIGYAKATSPLIDGSLEGPVVMRSSDNKLPDLVASLNGIIEVNVASRIDSFKRRIRSTFDLLPDVPVSSFELRMQGGKKGLIVNSANLCRTTSRASVELDGHNGKSHDTAPVVRPKSCAKPRKGKGAKQ